MNQIVWRTLPVFVSTVLICSALAFPVGAQWQQKKRKPELSRYTALTAPVPLPDMPPYAGPNKFLFGSQITGRGSGVSYIERFVIRDQPTQVHQWFQSTLANYGWKITLNTKTSLYAKKDGNFCSINFNGTYHEGWGSEIVLHYSPKE